MWSNDIFNKNSDEKNIKTLTDTISQYFTVSVVSIALIAGIYWAFRDLGTAAGVVTSVLIIACPCALALSAPFALGNMLRIFGYRKFYLKNDRVIEHIAHIHHVVFDKTGTITTNDSGQLSYEGVPLSETEKKSLKTLIRSSNHPLSRALSQYIKTQAFTEPVKHYKEITGKGISGEIRQKTIRIGSAAFVGAKENDNLNTSIYIEIDGVVKGYFKSKNIYRKNVSAVFKKLSKKYSISIISGDNDGEKAYLEKILPEGTEILFNQKPQDKLDYIRKLQEKHKQVMMVGDGLNDAGALAQSNVGIAISEDINVFSPACDAIMEAQLFEKLPDFMLLADQSIRIIKWSFAFSFLYNIIGMYFAVTARLTPLIAAILMPLSSISIVVFVTLLTNFVAKKR